MSDDTVATIVITVCAVMLGVGGYFIFSDIKREEIVPLSGLCMDNLKEAKAAVACKKDFNCVLTLGDYQHLVDVDEFIVRYCIDHEPKTSKVPKTTT